MRTALIDGDSFIYEATSANEYEAQWDHWLWSLWCDFELACAHFDRRIAEIKEAAEADAVVIALTDTTNWRKAIMPTYKHNRLKVRKPICYQPLREYCSEKYPTFMRPGLEGDDVLGILATGNFPQYGERIIVSIDKDLQTVPGRHMRLDDEEHSLRLITVEEADRFHLLQTLAGDPTDGYSGCPGIGMKTAQELLDTGLVLVPRPKTISRGPRKGVIETEWVAEAEGTPWEIVVSAYQSKGLGEEAALLNARVARICRASDYDFTKKEVKLWVP
jgi:5'-3' exonuclease